VTEQGNLTALYSEQILPRTASTCLPSIQLVYMCLNRLAT